MRTAFLVGTASSRHSHEKGADPPPAWATTLALRGVLSANDLARVGWGVRVDGIMQHQDGVRSVKVERLEALDKVTASIDASTHDTMPDCADVCERGDGAHCTTTRFNVVPTPNDADGDATPLMSASCSMGTTDG